MHAMMVGGISCHYALALIEQLLAFRTVGNHAHPRVKIVELLVGEAGQVLSTLVYRRRLVARWLPIRRCGRRRTAPHHEFAGAHVLQILRPLCLSEVAA